MTTLSHILSASYIGLQIAQVHTSETSLIVISLISAGIIDTDHIYLIIKNHKYFKSNGYKNNLHKARSILHEIAGFTLISTFGLLLSFFDIKLATVVTIPALIHIVEDILIGTSIPFNPIDKTEINLIPQNTIIKIILDVLVILTFSFLWLRYLNVIY